VAQDATFGWMDSRSKVDPRSEPQLSAMSVPSPHFLLYSHAAAHAGERNGESSPGRWRFELRSADGGTQVTADDEEACDSAERLELLAIVRGLESLDQPSRVTLVTANRGIRSGLKYGLAQWRESDWLWERYGKLTPVKNGDLWRRIDRAIEIHEVRCREVAFDAADDLAERTVVATPPPQQLRRDRRGRQLRIDRPASKNGGSRRHPRGHQSSGKSIPRRPTWLTRLRSLVDSLAGKTD
jgi:ribonuclease HI